MITLAVITVFFSSYFRIQLPRTKIHLTISDVMIILSMLFYGGEMAFILVAMETAFTSLNFRRQGVPIRPKTIAINVLIGSIAVFLTTGAVRLAFGSTQAVMDGGDTTTYVWLLALMAMSLFLFNSFGVSAFIALRSERRILDVWNEHCLNTLVMFLSGAVIAGVVARALKQTNVFLVAAVAGFFAIVYFTYKRYIDDIKNTSAIAEQAERERAELAERHVKELRHYVDRLEQSGKALEDSHRRFRNAAYHDALTGLPNRNYFQDKIQELLAGGQHFALLYLDLDRFKTINDSLGHTVGDRLIRNAANRLKRLNETNRIAGRFGGDEFAILLPFVAAEQDVLEFADQIAARLAEPYFLQGMKVFTSASVGIAFSNGTYEKPEDLLRDADIAMYHAKDGGQNCVVFDPKMHTKAVDLLQLETDLRYSIEAGEMEVYYQPIIDLMDTGLGGFEALVRWNHPTRGLVSPGEFIPICEATGLIVPLTLLILEKACTQVKRWQVVTGNRSLFISVNLSGKHFAENDLTAQVRDVLERSGLHPSNLKLEITETAVMENAESAITTLQELKKLGVRISMDDFGTGYSSLSHLHKFPIDTLKVDQSFVRTMAEGNDNGAIVRTIVTLAKSLKLSIVAEGVETPYQHSRLRALGCDYGQGYLFSRPLPVGEMN
jgi:diguanylate cyclase (GGDEF)-like protein